MVEVTQDLRLRAIALGPMPLLLQFVREGIRVFHAFDIAATPRVAVPVPGAADPATGLKGTHFEAEFTQAMDRVETADPGADDDRVKIQARLSGSSLGSRRQSVHAVIPIRNNRSDHASRSNRALSESRVAADCIARLSMSSALASRSCECPAAVRISCSSHDGDRTGTETSVIP